MYINLSPMIAKTVPTQVLWLHVTVISHIASQDSLVLMMQIL